MSTTATATHCPACGAKIARPELSLCSYCATPLGLGKETEHEPTKTMQRLARMRDHKDHELAMAWEPPDELEDPLVQPMRANASVRFLVGCLFGAMALLRWVLPGGAASWVPELLGIVGVSFIVISLVGRARAAAIIAEARKAPLLKRACLVRDRGSVMGDRGTDSTTYVFDLEFEDGSEGDFRYPGRGASHDPMTRGTTGIAYTRRDQLLAFKQIRV